MIDVGKALPPRLDNVDPRPAEHRMLLNKFRGVSETERQQIEEWNAHIPSMVESRVQDLFSKQATARPNAQCICSWDGELTYSQLDMLSIRLAHHLTKLGVGPEVFVPFCFEKSKHALISILAIMRAGGACVPLDPSHPSSRRETIIQAVKARVMLCSKANSFLNERQLDHIIVVDDQLLGQLEPAAGDPCPQVQPYNAVYVIFTSGSTGIPKGVVWEHRTLCTGSLTHGEALKFDKFSRTLQFAAYVFDVSALEMITTLLHGGCLCIPSDFNRVNHLAKTINEMRVNWAFLTPTVARLFSHLEVPSLEILNLGGEPTGQDNIDRWAPYLRLLIGYGPAECCVCVSVAELPINSRHSSIGKAVGGCLWITDPSDPNKLSPIGSVGEILIEGPILARGYLDDTAKTDSAFIWSPTWSKCGTRGQASRRFYRTGDLGRYNLDGSIDFVGRRDSQVKIRGQRLELGDVEHQVADSSMARDVVAMLPREGPFQDQLVAVITLSVSDQPQPELTPLRLCLESRKEETRRIVSKLAEFVQRRFPAHGVPSVWIVVEDIPKTASSKLDRLRVQEWIMNMSSDVAEKIRHILDEDADALPNTAMQERIGHLWSETLDIPLDRIRLRSSFLRLGGDSITAMKLVASARRRGISISVADVFQYPRLQELGQQARMLELEETVEDMPFSWLSPQTDRDAFISDITSRFGIEAASIEDVYPATPFQEALMALSSGSRADYSISTVHKLPKGIDLDRFCSACQSVAYCNAILRTRLVNTQLHKTLQVIVREGISWARGAGIDSYLQNKQAHSMGFGDRLAQYAIVDDFFVITIHHALFDGVTVPMLFKDIKTCYDSGNAPKHPPFKNFIRYLQQSDICTTQAYWRQQLAGAPQTTFPSLMPTSYRPRADCSLDRSLHFFRISTSDFTTATLARATWAVVIWRHTSLDDFTFGGMLSGRDVAVSGVEEIMGPTMATVPIRVKLRHDKSTAYFLQAIQDQMVGMIPHQHMGLQHIRRLSADAEAACRFQSSLVVYPLAEETPGLFQPAERGSSDFIDNFRTYAITIAFIITPEGAIVRGYFDSKIINEKQIQRMLRLFEQIFLNLLTEETVDDLTGREVKDRILRLKRDCY